MNRRKIVFLISYWVPDYIRARVLFNGLKKVPKIKIFKACNKQTNLIRYFQTILKALVIKLKENPKIWLINFRGHEIYWFVRFLIGKDKIILFDELVSPYDSLVNEVKIFSKNSLIAKVIFRIEKSILKNADFVITETKSQATYYSDLFNLPLKKFKVIPMSSDEKIFKVNGPKRKFEGSEVFFVFSYATFLPLHGMDIIIETANRLKKLPIRFIIVGGKNKIFNSYSIKKESLTLDNVIHIPWIDFNDLPVYIRGADLCLGGPFGNTDQGKRVITGKTLQFLACAKPTVIGRGLEDNIFEDRKNCILVTQGSNNSLADAVKWAYENRTILDEIGKKGLELYKKKFSEKVVSKHMMSLLKNLN